jgi:hypothetical protein
MVPQPEGVGDRMKTQRGRWMVMFAALAVGPAVAPTAAGAQTTEAVREVEVVVDNGYQPSRIEVRPGERVRLRFIRRDYGGCTREVVFPTLNLRRELPTDQPVVIDLPVLPVGETTFQCGMNMLRGSIVVAAPPAPAPPPPAPAPARRRPR